MDKRLQIWAHFLSMAEQGFILGNYQVINKVAMRTFPGKLTLSRPEMFLIIFTLHRSGGCWHILLSHGPQYATLFCLINISPSRYPNPLNILRPRRNGCQFSDHIFGCIFMNETVWISIKMSMKFVTKVQWTVFQHWIKLWLGAGQVTSRYLNQWWLISDAYRRHSVPMSWKHELSWCQICRYWRYDNKIRYVPVTTNLTSWRLSIFPWRRHNMKTLSALLAHCEEGGPPLTKTMGPFYKHGLTWTPTWISNYIHYKAWDEITSPF